MDLVWYGVGSHRLKHRYMRDWVDCTHAVQKLKSIRCRASLGDDFKGAKVLLSKFLLRLSDVEELHFDKHMRTNSELRSHIPPSIS